MLGWLPEELAGSSALELLHPDERETLKHLPVGYIKVDVEFVRTLTADSPHRQVVSAIVDVARSFGIQTIAEGVESQATLKLLRALGVDLARGFHLGRPKPIEVPGY